MIWTHTNPHTLTHIHSHTLAHTHTHTLTHSYTLAHIHTLTQTLTHINTHSLAYTHTLTYTRTHSHTHTNTHTHTHLLTYTHTQTHICACHIISLLFLLGEESKYKLQRHAWVKGAESLSVAHIRYTTFGIVVQCLCSEQSCIVDIQWGIACNCWWCYLQI